MSPRISCVPGQFHYFIEYQHRASVGHALQLRLGSSAGLVVHPIYSDHQLVDQFRSCEAYGSSRQPTRPDDTAIRPMQGTEYPSVPPHEDRNTERCPPEGYFSEYGVSHNRYDPRDSAQRHIANSLPSMPAPAHVHTTVNDTVSGSSTQVPLDTSPVSFSLDSRFVMDIQGQHIVYDLTKDPEQDPKIVIELLKLSSSERGSWMIAGAHFRRMGKPRAAIDVMYAMLEALVNHGFTEVKLKPVFLLLSGCELDMAICARNAGDLAASEQHYANVRMWLQKVYGTRIPATSTQPPASLVSSVVQSNQIQPEPPRPSHPMEIDHFSPHQTTAESMAGRKRKMEGSSSGERNIRRRHSGIPRTTKKTKHYSGNKKSWKFK